MISVVIVLSAIILVLCIGIAVFLFTAKRGEGISRKEAEAIVKEESDYQTRAIQSAVAAANSALLNAITMHTETQGKSVDRFLSVVAENLKNQDVRQQEFIQNVHARLDSMKQGLEKTLTEVRNENTEQLNKMRQVVEEKMQETLTTRLNQSFEQISKQLDNLKVGLGEMKALTDGVTDLKKVLGGVKTRGVWGEISLGTLIGEILNAEQYGTNVKIGRKGEVVEFAVKLPGKGEDPVLLPIDAKFPLEDYQRLVDASEIGDKPVIDAMGAALERRIKEEAKTIAEKYIKPPQTTDFAVMYLPIEGLFAEVAKRPGLLEAVQAKYRVMVTGPTTLAALLNSLLVGFKTVAIEKRSREIVDLLAAFRTEFVRFAEMLDKTQGYVDKASEGIRNATNKSNQIRNKLSKVELLEDAEPKDTLPEG
ncbi:MAG TPA: DNA recombination protein RmuC [Clostridiales bacterium]|nr:DNA recombination protein RmuC [Clostridiales bacterium]